GRAQAAGDAAAGAEGDPLFQGRRRRLADAAQRNAGRVCRHGRSEEGSSAYPVQKGQELAADAKKLGQELRRAEPFPGEGRRPVQEKSLGSCLRRSTRGGRSRVPIKVLL